MKYNVLDRERKVFKFSDIFIICWWFYNKKPQWNQSWKIPFLGATDSNNWVTQFNSFKDIDSNSKTWNWENEPIEKKIFKWNCIAVTNNGSVWHAYYWKNSFTCSHDINPLYLRNYELTPFIAKFLITCIEQQAVSFMYSRKRRPKRMKKSSILLPIDDLWNPDYKFMEDFIKEREKNKREKYRKYVENIIKTLDKNWDFRERERS